MGLRSSRLIEYDEAKEKISQIVAQFESGYARHLMVRVPVKNRREGDIFKHSISYNDFYEMFITPVFPAMPDFMVQRLFHGFSNGNDTLGLKDFVSGIAVIMCGSLSQRVEFLGRCYDPKGSGYISLKTLKRVTAEIDSDRRRERSSNNFLRAVLHRCVDYSGFAEISVKEFHELATRDEHADAPAITWLQQFCATLVAASRPGAYRHGSGLHKENTLTALHRATNFSEAQIDSLNVAARFIKSRYSRSGFLDGQALLSLLAPPAGFVPPLVLQQLMRQLDSTNTGTVSLRELVLGLARLGFDRAHEQDMTWHFVFQLFADAQPTDLPHEGAMGMNRGQEALPTRQVLGAKSSVPPLNSRMSRRALRDLAIAFGVGARRQVDMDLTSSDGSSGDDSLSLPVHQQVSLEDIVIDDRDVDDDVVDAIVDKAFASALGDSDTETLDLGAFKQWEAQHGRALTPSLPSVWTLVFVELTVRPSVPALERKVIDACMQPGPFDPNDPGEVGTMWYMLPAAWMNLWRQYTASLPVDSGSSPSTSSPGAINTNVFFMPLSTPSSASGNGGKHSSVLPSQATTSNIKKPGLIHGQDYELVTSRVFQALSSWYCSGRCRSVPVTVVPAFSAESGCDREVEVYKLRLTLLEAGAARPRQIATKQNGEAGTPVPLPLADPKNPPRLFSRRTTLRELQGSAKQYYRYCASGKVPLSKTRVLLRVPVELGPGHGSHGPGESAGTRSRRSTPPVTAAEDWLPLEGDELTLADLGIQDLSLIMLDFKISTDSVTNKKTKKQGGGTKGGDGHSDQLCDADDAGDDEACGEVWMHDLVVQEQEQKLAKKRHGSGSNGANDASTVTTAQQQQQRQQQLALKKRRNVFSRAYKENVLGVVGLKNMGNTCYMNASLQCLAACRLLREYFLDNTHWSYDLNTSPNAHRLGMGGKLAVSFSELLDEMWSASNAGAAIAPKMFKKTIGRFNHRFKGYQQQDAQELISTLLGALHEDLNRIHEKPYNEQPDSNNRSDEVVAQEWWRNHLRRDLSVITALFTGQFKSSLTCQVCHYESSRFEPFSFLPVPLPENPKRYQLVRVHGYGVEPLQVSICVETTSTVQHVLEELLKLFNADYLAHKEFYDLRSQQRGKNEPASPSPDSSGSFRSAIAHRTELRGSHSTTAEPLGLGKVSIKDLRAVVIDHNRIGDVLPATSSLSGFDYRQSVVHVVHAPLLGGNERGVDLTSPDAVGEIVRINLNGHIFQGVGAPVEALYQKNKKFYPATISRIYAAEVAKGSATPQPNVAPGQLDGSDPTLERPAPSPDGSDSIDGGQDCSVIAGPAPEPTMSCFGIDPPLMCEVKWNDGDHRYREMPYSPSKVRFTAKYTHDMWLLGKVLSLCRMPAGPTSGEAPFEAAHHGNAAGCTDSETAHSSIVKAAPGQSPGVENTQEDDGTSNLSHLEQVEVLRKNAADANDNDGNHSTERDSQPEVSSVDSAEPVDTTCFSSSSSSGASSLLAPEAANSEPDQNECQLCANVQVCDFPGTVLRGIPVLDTSRIRSRWPLVCQLYFVHRRLEPMRQYFLYSHVPKLFGTPFMLRLATEGMTTKDLYGYVFDHVRRLCPNWVAPEYDSVDTGQANPRRGRRGNANREQSNQWTGSWVLAAPGGVSTTLPASRGAEVALGKDSRPGPRPKPYWGEFESALRQYPFRLCQVTKHGTACAVCDWIDGSSGALIPPDQRLVSACLPNHETIAIDWDPNLFEEGGTYSLREEQRTRQHESIAQHRLEKAKPTDLESCLEKFAGAEKLKAYCSRCTRANGGDFTETDQEKKMGCWALPPLLVVQLKRFKTVQRPGYGKASPASAYSYKLCNVIDIPERLDLSSFVSPDAHPDGDTKAQDIPKMLRPEEVQKLECDLAQLEKDGDSDATFAESVRKRQAERAKALSIDEMVRAVPPTLSRANVQYELFAVCHHAGSIKAGHYYAYVKGAKAPAKGGGSNKSGESSPSGETTNDQVWRLCNDQRVSDVKDFKEVTAPGAYLLYYQRVDLKAKAIGDVYPYNDEKPPQSDMIDFVKKQKWDAPKQPEQADGTGRKKNRAEHNETSRGLLSNCNVQ